MTTQTSGLTELTDDELDSVAGAFHISLNLGFAKANLSITDAGATGAVKVGDGPWHGGTIWFPN